MHVRAPDTGYLLPFLPDAYFEVSSDVQACVVEIDMGTLTLRRFARKVRAFETALDDHLFRRHFKRDDFEVLVLTQSLRRLEALRQVPAVASLATASAPLPVHLRRSARAVGVLQCELVGLGSEECVGVLLDA